MASPAPVASLPPGDEHLGEYCCACCCPICFVISKEGCGEAALINCCLGCFCGYCFINVCHACSFVGQVGKSQRDVQPSDSVMDVDGEAKRGYRTNQVDVVLSQPTPSAPLAPPPPPPASIFPPIQ